MFRIIFTILVIITVGFVYGQEAPNLSFTRYGIEDGLPNMTMNVLGQDSVGYIWLANPLTRFDGKNFKTFREQPDLASSSLITAVSMFDDEEGNLFFASREGIYYYDSRKQNVRKIPSTPYNYSKRSILKSDSSTFWDFSPKNLFKIELPSFDTTHIYVKEMENAHHIFAQSGDENIWIIHKKKGVIQLDLKTLKKYNYKIEGLKDLSKAFFVRDKDKELWLVSDLGLWKFNESANEFTTVFIFKENPNFNNISIESTSFQVGNNCWWVIDRLNDIVYRYDISTNDWNSIKIGLDIDYDFKRLTPFNAIESPDGSLLLGTIREGFIAINPLNGLIKQYLPERNNTNSLFNKSAIPELSIDNSSIILSGVGQGIIKADFQNPIFDTFILPESSVDRSYAKNIRALLEWKKKVIVGSISSINLFDRNEKTFVAFPMPGNLPSPHPERGASTITSDKLQNLLIIYWIPKEDAEIFYLDYSNNRTLNLTDTFSETSFYASNVVFTDSKNNFWIAIQSGVIKLNAEVLAKGNLENIRDQADFYSFKKFQPSVNDLHKIYAITEDKKGLIWVGTNSGLFRISPATKLIEAFKNSQQEKTSLSSDDVRSIIASYDSQIWVGTSNGGLNKFVEETNSFERYSINDGLPDNTIYSIAEDREQKLWLGTNKGLCWFDPITLQSQLYSPEDGVQSYEFNTNSVCKTSDDWLLFGGVNGFNMFSPAKISSSASSKNLVFTSIKVNNQEYPITDDQLSLSHNENFISFEFNLLDFYKNDKIQYAYKLDGLEKDWNYLRSAQKASYPGLNPGNYTFMVKAASHNGLWSDEVTLLHLYIAQPWWKSLWFIILSGSLFAAIIYTFYKNRQIQREKIIELRHRISQDLHDEIGSTLSSISLFGTVAHKLAGSNPVGTQDMLTKINESTTQVMESMNDIVWAINSDNDKVGNLQKRMRAFISELDDASDVNISLQVDENLKDTFINMVQRRNVYLIFKEATNNAFKYANASQINITLSQSNNLYKLLIQDNGIGFELSELASKTSLGGNGLKNMKQRAGELNGTLEIISSKNQGSEISFSWNPKSNPALSHNK